MRSLTTTKRGYTSFFATFLAGRLSAGCGLLAVAALGLGLGACSSGLEHRVDDDHFDNVPDGKKDDVEEAQAEAEKAKEELEKITSEYDQIEDQVDKAESEKEQAKVSYGAAETALAASQKGGTSDMRNSAARNKEVANLRLRSAEKKLEYHEKKKEWLEKAKEAATLNHQKFEAKAEWEKAKLIEDLGVKPDVDFSADTFEAQYEEKEDEWEDAKEDADELAEDLKKLEQGWKDAEQKFGAAKGK